MELTEEDADRSGSGARGVLGVFFSLAWLSTFSDSGSAISGDCDKLCPVMEGGAGNVALATRGIGDRV